MRDQHAYYDGLAGALALGEIKPFELEELTSHARGCSACAADLASFSDVAGRIASAREAERWNPGIDRALAVRMQEQRERTTRRTVVAFGYAIAVSACVNIFFVGGFAGRFADAMRIRSESAPVSTAALAPASVAGGASESVAADGASANRAPAKSAPRRPAYAKSAPAEHSALVGLAEPVQHCKPLANLHSNAATGCADRRPGSHNTSRFLTGR